MSEDTKTNQKLVPDNDEKTEPAAESKSEENKPEAKQEPKEKVDESPKKETERKKPEDKEDKAKNQKIDLKPGMTIRIHQKIKEVNLKGEEKERIQYFEGMIISKKHGQEAGATITVRKISHGVGVEKIFPIHLPAITKIEVKKQAKVRRAKLGYLKQGYKKRLKETKVDLVEVRG